MLDREKIDLAVGEVLFNVSNYPKGAHGALWGQDIGPLREKVTEAVLAVIPQIRADLLREVARSADDQSRGWPGMSAFALSGFAETMRGYADRNEKGE